MNFLVCYIRGRLKSFLYAGRGLWIFISSEAPALLHLIVILVVMAAGWWFDISPIEWMILILTVAALLSAELLNSAIERLGNAITTDRHPMIGKAKDLAAGAVLILSIAALIVAAIIFIPKIKSQFTEQPESVTVPRQAD